LYPGSTGARKLNRADGNTEPAGQTWGNNSGELYSRCMLGVAVTLGHKGHGMCSIVWLCAVHNCVVDIGEKTNPDARDRVRTLQRSVGPEIARMKRARLVVVGWVKM